MDAVHEAERRVEMMLARIGDVRPDVIPVTDYADEETFNFVLPSPGWTFNEWHAVNQEVARLLRERGLNVVMVPLALNDYFDFLTEHRLANSTEARAQFAAFRLQRL